MGVGDLAELARDANSVGCRGMTTLRGRGDEARDDNEDGVPRGEAPSAVRALRSESLGDALGESMREGDDM